MNTPTPTPITDKAKIAFTSLFVNDDGYCIPYVVGVKLERELTTVTEQRDRLAVVVNRWRKGKHSGEYGVALRRCISEIDEALQSINQPTEP